jgi:tetratricopeptide (TPR) repeat protein
MRLLTPTGRACAEPDRPPGGRNRRRCRAAALALFQETGDRYGAASAWDSLGYAHHQLRQLAAAVECYQRAIDLYRDFADPYEAATTLTKLGDTHDAAGAPDDARAAWRAAREILTDLGHPDAEAVRARLARSTESSAAPPR